MLDLKGEVVAVVGVGREITTTSCDSTCDDPSLVTPELAVLELKLAGRVLSYRQYRQLLGVDRGVDPVALFRRTRDALPEWARDWWEAHPSLLRGGLIYQGRFERYLTLCHAAKVEPIIVLTKTDLVSDEELASISSSIQGRVKNVPLLTISNETREGYQTLESMIEKGKTYCMLGSSGVGKSTLLNNLSGKEVMKTDAISGHSQRGKHVTSHREMVLLDKGGILIDNPGMREVGILDMEIYQPDVDLRLDERKLAEKLGISRTPIREALARLAQEGLVQIVPALEEGRKPAGRGTVSAQHVHPVHVHNEPAAQELAAGAAEDVAADLVDI